MYKMFAMILVAVMMLSVGASKTAGTITWYNYVDIDELDIHQVYTDVTYNDASDLVIGHHNRSYDFGLED